MTARMSAQSFKIDEAEQGCLWCRRDALARIGGEEFANLSPTDDAAEAMTLAERLRENIITITVDDAAGVLSFTVSIGVADAEPGENTVTGVLARADQDLYEAKRSGRNRVVRNLS